MPKGVVTDDDFNWGDDRPPNVPWSDTVIYEAHVRGPDHAARRTCGRTSAAPSPRWPIPRVIDHLRRLGVTAVELLPIHAFVQDRHLLRAGPAQLLGLQHARLLRARAALPVATASADEMRIAVRRLHAAGIEVILDVVYNHTAEGNEFGPTLSFRGLDNASYYRLVPDDPRHYINDTGTGNTLNLSHPRVLQMVMDSLRYWVDRVPCRRLPLRSRRRRSAARATASIPARASSTRCARIRCWPRVKLISEPWDIGPGGYQLGNHPPGFAEWNDRFRDGVRRFWRGDAGQRPEFAARLAGSSDLFDQRGAPALGLGQLRRRARRLHLADIVSYAERHNEANGEDNNDGHAENYSANWGVEGPTDDPAINDTRGALQRAMLATVFLAQGTPMLLAGDEFGRTPARQQQRLLPGQRDLVDRLAAGRRAPRARLLTDFVARLIALRHEHPVLRCATFLHGRDEPAPGMLDIAWFDEHGEIDLAGGVEQSRGAHAGAAPRRPQCRRQGRRS